MAITVGVAGITGKFARRVVSHLLQHSDITIRGYCRDPSKVPTSISSSEKVALLKGDAFDREAIRSFVAGCDVIVCCYLGDDKLMVEGQKALIDACEEVGVPRYVASDWALDYTKLKLGELFPKDPMIHVKAYLDTKEKVKGVHILIGGFIEPVLSPFFNILDPQTHTFRYWGEGDEYMEGTTYDNAAEFTVAVIRDVEATGVVRCMFYLFFDFEMKRGYVVANGFKIQSSVVVPPSVKLHNPMKMSTASRPTLNDWAPWTSCTRPCTRSGRRILLTSTATWRCMSLDSLLVEASSIIDGWH